MGRRQSETRGLFEYREQWIDRIPGRPGYYRFWYDKRKRRVKRRSLNGSTLSAAKQELIDLLAETNVSAQAPESVLLADVLAHYLQHHARLRGPKTEANARCAAQHAMRAMMTLVDHPRVADLTRIRQQLVWAHLAEHRKLSAKSISTYMITIRAAINFASVPQIIKVDDPTSSGARREEEVRYLTETVPIFCSEEEIAERIGAPVSTPRDFIPTFEEFGRWLDAIVEESDFRFVMIALNTWARNEAIFDLRIDGQVDFEFGLLDLNPPGRRQTKKRRPVIRLTTGLAAWLKHWQELDHAQNDAERERAAADPKQRPARLVDENRPVEQYQDTVEKRINRIGKTVAVGLPEMTCYTIRHFMATHARRTSFNVSKEQRSLWMGHTVKGGSRTTDRYEKFDPDYLEGPMRATEEIIRKLDNVAKRNLFAPTMSDRGSLRVVQF